MSLYDQATIGTSTNQIVFNSTASHPYFRVQSRAPQRRELRDMDIPVPFESGIMDFETLIGKTAYVINGTMYPGSESDHDKGLAALRKLASLDVAQDDNLSDDGYVPYVWQEFSRQKQLNVKVLYVNITENTKQGMVKQFSLICKIKDPTIFGASDKIATTLEADPTGGTGSAAYPIEYPIAYGASTYSVTSTAINDGDIASFPVGITVYGPCVSPKITNTTTGEFIQLSGVTLTSTSNVLRIAYDKDTLSVELDGVNVLPYVTNTSTFFKIKPGGNTITLTGSSVGSGAYAELTYRDSWPLS